MEKFVYQVVLSPDEGGGFDAVVPDLPGCFSFGDTREEAIAMAADAAKTYVASLMLHGDPIPASSTYEVDGAAFMVFFEVDADYIVEGETVSAAEASRLLGVSPGRVTHMLDSGILKGYRRGRRTYVTIDSINDRIASNPGSGRPRAALG